MNGNNDQPDLNLRRRRAVAWLCVLMMALVVAASAWLRLAAPRPACHDWPGCRSELRPALGVAPDRTLGSPGLIDAVRATHRLAASSVLLMLVAVVALAPRGTRQGALLRRRALPMLALALGLALLGVVTSGARSTAVLLGNQLGGLWLLAMAWALSRELSGVPPPGRLAARWAGGAAGMWCAQAALGALAGAVGHGAPVAHVALALPCVAVAGGLGWTLRRQGINAEGNLLLALAVGQIILGASAAAAAASVPLVLLHQAAGALGIALLGGLALARPR